MDVQSGVLGWHWATCPYMAAEADRATPTVLEQDGCPVSKLMRGSLEVYWVGKLVSAVLLMPARRTLCSASQCAETANASHLAAAAAQLFELQLSELHLCVCLNCSQIPARRTLCNSSRCAATASASRFAAAAAAAACSARCRSTPLSARTPADLARSSSIWASNLRQRPQQRPVSLAIYKNYVGAVYPTVNV